VPGSMFRSDAAVSESLGYIIITGILLTALAIIFAIGFPVYNNYVDQSHMQNMIEGFDLVSENANNVAMLRTPYQQSELKLFEGTIALKGAGNMLVECYSYDGATYHQIVPTGSNSSSGDSVALRTLEYSKGDSSIAYLLGGVFKKDTYTYPVIKKPAMYTFTREDGTPVLVMPLISLYNSQSALAGNALARISFGTLYYSKKNQVIPQPDLRIYDHVQLIRITLESDYNDCLLPYFRDDLGFIVTASVNGKLVMEKTYAVPGITVNTIQSTVIATINSGSV
jgi:hypothetical protein